MESVGMGPPKGLRLATSMLCHAGRPSHATDGRTAKVAFRTEASPTRISIVGTMALLDGRIVGRPMPQIAGLSGSARSRAGRGLAAGPTKMPRSEVQKRA